MFEYFYSITATAEVRVKRQEDDDGDSQNIDELCQDRPADEYFRSTLEGDCRDVVRYKLIFSLNSSNI